VKEIRAIIADDEDTLREYLRRLLAEIWPELVIVAEASNGNEALSLIRDLEPEIAFLDINMPGLTGLNVAQHIGVDCRIVFITAYNEFAVKAFELEAVDYLLKPLDKARLSKTVDRLQQQISQGAFEKPDLTQLLQKLNHSLGNDVMYIRWIKASDQGKVYVIPVEDVRYFKAGEKYTSVVTHNKQWLIRKPVKELEKELDPAMFWRIHRGVIVNASCIISASRTIDGRYEMQVMDCNDTLVASRAYAHRFKHM
jgi:DNA-binding LytR/AlgR family response regulator